VLRVYTVNNYFLKCKVLYYYNDEVYADIPTVSPSLKNYLRLDFFRFLAFPKNLPFLRMDFLADIFRD
jgi:hypothetical protein